MEIKARANGSTVIVEFRWHGNFYYYEVKVPLKQRLLGKGK